MTDPTNDVLFPTSLVFPTQQGVNPLIAGQIMLSGATLIWFDGSSVQVLSGSNTGD